MLKVLLYGSLGLVAVVVPLASPVAGVASVIGAYMVNPVSFSPELASFRFQFLTSIAFFIGIALYRSPALPKVSNESRTMFALAAFALVAIGSSFWAVFDSYKAYDAAVELGKTVIISLLFPLAITSERHMRIVMWVCVIGVAHAVFIHVVGGNLGWISSARAKELGVLPDSQSSVVTFFIPSVAILAIHAKSLKGRVFCGCVLLLMLDSIVNTYQRAYFVSLLAELVVLMLVLPWRTMSRVVPIGVFALLVFAAVFAPQNYWEKMNTISEYETEGSASSRFVVWDASMQMLSDFPLGVGYDNYGRVSPRYLEDRWLTTDRNGNRVRSAHNSIATVVCETGIIGFTLYFYAFFGTAWTLFSIRRRADASSMTDLESFASGLGVGMVGWAIGGLFHSDHEVDPVFWTVGFAVVICRCQYWRQKEELDHEFGAHGESVPMLRDVD